ncbi:hypothetical protein NA56DRAFT_329512 [Hyaloscypha hepaticicola]|uniref:Zn(2)-C6 fungal-type domain-containing protein n=1 Tax=Hyaloscypha hepaticicola TaxID=2082293 RepID=A0A2J6PNX1_9HELO|nr:hypothetical protein NA56DRAFT_329512 [Hyaloscypha hepaticicola]
MEGLTHVQNNCSRARTSGLVLPRSSLECREQLECNRFQDYALFASVCCCSMLVPPFLCGVIFSYEPSNSFHTPHLRCATLRVEKTRKVALSVQKMLSDMASNKDVPSNYMQPSLDILAHQLQYGLQQMEQSVRINQNSGAHDKGHNCKHRQHPYHGTGAKSANDSSRIRRRITLACDQCNQQRTKCDGQSPCARCSNFDSGCTYVRQRKKRGKVSRKDLAQRAAAAANQQKSPMDQALDEQSPLETPITSGSSITLPANDTRDFQQPKAFTARDLTSTELNGRTPTRQQLQGRWDAGSHEGEKSNNHQMHAPNSLQFDQTGSPISLNLDDYSSTPEYRSVLYLQMIDCNNPSTFTTAQMNTSCHTNSPYSIHARNPTQYLVNSQGLLYSDENPLSGFSIRSDVASPGEWITLRSPSHQGLKYEYLDKSNHS